MKPKIWKLLEKYRLIAGECSVIDPLALLGFHRVIWKQFAYIIIPKNVISVIIKTVFFGNICADDSFYPN